ncbi:hypothetical protein AK812_SmicGene6427 [Symbiodinium microadriaticum]|uniref:Uncharacterized protein n=1 Tax=Symbiodinium microadriaticum TaxID=2951 RepID=A0A1Q9ERD7_SYMMI|nr:hypothetical protein AK812_SmicGene6427 [Symbiodinium microadriaticum]
MLPCLPCASLDLWVLVDRMSSPLREHGRGHQVDIVVEMHGVRLRNTGLQNLRTFSAQASRVGGNERFGGGCCVEAVAPALVLVVFFRIVEKPIPMILVLHNADYMGVIETDFINDRCECYKIRILSMNCLVAVVAAIVVVVLRLVFNLRIRAIRKYVLFEGRFNMLKAGVAYIKETQNGHGVCAVSANYAAELKRASASQASATLVITSGSNHHEGNDELM